MPEQPNALARGSRGTILVFCYNYGPHNHTGGFRWRAMQRELAPLGWTLHMVAAAREGLGDEASEARPLVAVDDTTITTRIRGALSRWQARRSKRRARRIVTVDPETVPIRPAGQPLGTAEALRAGANGALDAWEAWTWSRRALKSALRATEEHRFDAVVATTPEVSAPLAAAVLARRRKLPLIIDYRDPVYFGRGPERARLDPLTRRLWRSWERRFLKGAAAIADISPGAHRDSIAELAKEAPDLAEIPRFCVPSGHEPRRAGPVDPHLFRIVYTGWIWPFMPLPRLFSAVGALRRARRLDPGMLRLELIGVEPSWSGIELEALAAGAGLADCFQMRPRVGRAEAAAAQEHGAVLVVFDSVCAHGICIPSKLYAYAPCRGRILAIGRPDGAMAEEAARIGVPTLDPEDRAGIVARLAQAFDDWRAGRLTIPNDPGGVLSAANRAQEMARVLETAVEGPARLRSLAW